MYDGRSGTGWSITTGVPSEKTSKISWRPQRKNARAFRDPLYSPTPGQIQSLTASCMSPRSSSTRRTGLARPHNITGVTELDLAWFASAVRAHAPQWERTGIRWQLTFGPERDKSAAWVDCETGDLTGQLIVWTTGEAELAAGNLAMGANDLVHYELASPQEIGTCLDDLTLRLTRQD